MKINIGRKTNIKNPDKKTTKKSTKLRIPKTVWLSLGLVAAALLLFFSIIGISYYNSAQVTMGTARELKAAIKMSAYYVKEGDPDSADACISIAESCIVTLREDLSDGKWKTATFIPFAGSGIKADMENAEKTLDIADEAINTVLKPASNYIRELGMPDVANIDMENMGPDMAVRIYSYCDMIDELCPAAMKIAQEIDELPTFNTPMLEEEVAKYRSLPAQAYILVPMLESASNDILRPAADVMSETPFSDLRNKPGINIGVIKAYWDLLDDIKPHLMDINTQLYEYSKTIEDSQGMADTILKLTAIINLINEADNYRPLFDAIIGDGEDRTFIIVAQNSAEMRACGGFPGSIGSITIKNGIAYYEDFQSIVNVIPDTHASTIEISDIENDLFVWDWYGNNPRRASCNPHFPRTAELWAESYGEYNDVHVDGVISFTPHIIGRLLTITGPITLSNGVTIDDTNAVDYLQRQIYIDYFNELGVVEANDITDALFAETAKELCKELMDNLGKDTIFQLLEIITASSKDRVFMMWMADPEAEEIITELGFSGSLNSDPENPAIGVFFSVNDANKLGPYLDMQISVDEGIINEDNTISYPVTVVVTNNIDEETIALTDDNAYVLGYDYGADMNSLIYMFAPAGGTVSDFENDGDVPITIDEYSGLQVGYCSKFLLEPGEVITFTYIATTAPGVTAAPSIMTQPLLTDYRTETVVTESVDEED